MNVDKPSYLKNQLFLQELMSRLRDPQIQYAIPLPLFPFTRRCPEPISKDESMKCQHCGQYFTEILELSCNCSVCARCAQKCGDTCLICKQKISSFKVRHSAVDQLVFQCHYCTKQGDFVWAQQHAATCPSYKKELVSSPEESL